MPSIDFTTRESYVAYRAEWRLQYREASEAVRQAKRDLVAAHAERRAAQTDKERERIGDEQSSLQYHLHMRRVSARDMMVQLGKAKERKDALMAALREQKAA